MKWIKINKNNLPKTSEVLITNGNYVMPAEFGMDKGNPYFYDGTGIRDDVTHWMEFPLPPNEDGE